MINFLTCKIQYKMLDLSQESCAKMLSSVTYFDKDKIIIHIFYVNKKNLCDDFTHFSNF